jgi:hypothetical protein
LNEAIGLAASPDDVQDHEGLMAAAVVCAIHAIAAPYVTPVAAFFDAATDIPEPIVSVLADFPTPIPDTTNWLSVVGVIFPDAKVVTSAPVAVAPV